ncbi:casein kinase II beta subunit [Hesseltinella vesiculosa]|uniref:Casein kinase II subunit beta n=1 Tax=Hesseltinella vesiculosa TaxID=101127 RepID=A0A1X2G2A4_9FUNG|nr:casein kinase II beta subunit [Hesseltinella vesiculosa]
MTGNGVSWINWFCSKKGNEFYVKVPIEYIMDGFNLTGLASLTPLYKEALEMILDIESEDDEMSNKIPDISLLEPHAIAMYGMIHQRYITTRAGLNRMLTKYKSGVFGTCPRYYCQGSKVLPCGQADRPKEESLRLYCPNCKDIYIPNDDYHAALDGAHFGTTFPHLFTQAFEESIPPFQSNTYTPKLFGFKLSGQSPTGPTMQWLRLNPDGNVHG